MAKRKPLRFGKNSPPAVLRECDDCGGKLRASVEGALVCGSCAGRAKRRLADKSESVDRSEDDDERAEFRAAYMDLIEGDE